MTRRPQLLYVYMDGVALGLLTRHENRIVLTYDDGYRSDPDATPVSTGMPLTAQEHSGRPVANFLDGLLPDNSAVRERWARRFSCRNVPFDLLAHVGEDCAGALQFVRPERRDELTPGERQPQTNAEIAERIRALRDDPAGWLEDSGGGQFSLAGAQAKFALLFDEDRWWRPSGATPTTHIIKPAPPQLPGHELNEHLCLRLAAAIGLPSARSQVVDFDGERAVAVERYDRFHDGECWRRVHQEDLCQALGIAPANKYENHRGPTAAAVVRLLRQVTGEAANESVARFITALAFNWFIGGTDAHAKNYALLLSGPDVRFGPLYDLGSALPYTASTPTPNTGRPRAEKLTLAMRVGKEYRLQSIRRGDWLAMGAMVDVGDDIEQLVSAAGEAIIEVMPTVMSSTGQETFGPEFGEMFARKVIRHTKNCLMVLDGKPPAAWR
jgi:serine/threonine-protein kinase HipA